MIKHRQVPVYWFGWPSHLGGADTKLAHTLWLLRGEYAMTVVPNSREQWEQPYWREWLHGLGIKTALLEELPSKLEGWGVSLCNGEFWGGGIAARARKRGLKIAWSSEMMWHHGGERMAAELGLIDKVLYASEVQRQALEPGYAGEAGPVGRASSRAGEASDGSRVRSPHQGISGRYPNGMGWVITGNYIAPEFFPWRDRTTGRRFEEFVIGRLSRPDPAKYPADFPESYQRLGLGPARYRAMAWSERFVEFTIYDLRFTSQRERANRISSIVNRPVAFSASGICWKRRRKPRWTSSNPWTCSCMICARIAARPGAAPWSKPC